MKEWYRRPGNASRVRGWVKRYRDENAEEIRAKDRVRGFRIYDIKKVRARAQLHKGLATGLVIKEACEVCGDPNVHGHHNDYNKPLEVQWLCPSHHGEAHRKYDKDAA